MPSRDRYAGPHGSDYVRGKSSLDIMLEVLRAMGGSTSTMDRLALASTVSHGEWTWVSEAAFHARDRGVRTSQEASVGAARRVDLQIGGTAVEFKSTHGAWALSRADAERDLWFGPDIAKLRGAGVPGLMVITVASLTLGVEHQRSTPGYRYEPARAGGNDPSGLLLAGLSAASRFLTAAECLQVEEVSLGGGRVPGNGGEVLLGAVVGVVNADGL